MNILKDSVYPVTLRVMVTREASSDIDLTTVTDANIHCRMPKLTNQPTEDYLYVDWTPTVETHTESLVYLLYPFAGGDLSRVGTYTLAIDLEVPSGTLPCTTTTFQVVDRM